MRTSMRHQKRNRRLVQEIVSNAAEQPLAKPRMTVSAQDDQVALSLFGFCNQPLPDLAVVALDVMQGGIYSMMLEMIDRIGTHGCLFFGDWAVRDHHDCNLAGLL